MIFNTNTQCDPTESILIQVPLSENKQQKVPRIIFQQILGRNSIKVIQSSSGSTYLLKPILQMKKD